MPRLKGNKKALTETQTLRASCSKAEPKISFSPPLTPFPGARDGQNSIRWRWSLPLPTNPVWWGSMHAISSYRGNRSTHPPANTARPPVANRQDRLQYTAPLLALGVIRWLRTFLLSDATSHTVHVVNMNTACSPWAGMFCLISRHARVHDFCPVYFARA